MAGKEGLNPSEAFSTPRNPDGLSLEHIKGIKVGETLLTPEILQADAEAFKGNTFRFGLDQLNEEQLIRVFAYEKLPFRITGDTSAREPVTLQAEVRLFPYTITAIYDKEKQIKEYDGFSAHAIRFMPEPGGKIEKVELNKDHTMALSGLPVVNRKKTTLSI